MQWKQLASKVTSIPLLRKLSPGHVGIFSDEDKAGFLQCQRLAEEAAHEVASLIQEGWTEKDAATLLETAIRDRGVEAFFHHAFAWFGERTRFDEIKYPGQFQPSTRVIRPGEVFILDAAPIYKGYIADIGFTSSLGENLEWKKAQQCLATLHREIPALFSQGLTGAQIYEAVNEKLRAHGYENRHQKYPLGVLGHRVHQNIPERVDLRLFHFGWQSFWSLASRGIFGQALNADHVGDLTGLWAIEPHLGTTAPPGPERFGAKFEEILVVEPGTAYWLENERTWQ